MGRNTNSTPTKHQIFAYWSAAGYDGQLDDCMFCRFKQKTQRAHIIAHCDGGADASDNLVLLCRICHPLTDGFTIEQWQARLIGPSTERRSMFDDFRMIVSLRSGENTCNRITHLFDEAIEPYDPSPAPDLRNLFSDFFFRNAISAIHKLK